MAASLSLGHLVGSLVAVESGTIIVVAKRPKPRRISPNNFSQQSAYVFSSS